MTEDQYTDSEFTDKPNPMESAKGIIQKIGIAPIALIIIAILIYVAFTALPKSGNLTIHAIPYDDTAGISDAVVTVLVDGARNPYTQDTDASGYAEFKNIPTGKELSIEIDAGSEYKIASTSEKLENGETKDVTIQVSKQIPATFKQPTITGSITETCVKPVNVEIENKGEDAIEITLAGSGDLQDVKTEPQVIGAGQSATITAQIDASKTGKKKNAQIKGDIRIKGTDTHATVTFKVDESPKIEVTPTSISCSIGKVCQQIVTIKNTGTSSIDNYQVLLSESITSSVQKQDFDTVNSIPPGAETKFGITINAVTDTIGVISINADCYSKKLDVKIA